jgi:hypothetical protein
MLTAYEEEIKPGIKYLPDFNLIIVKQHEEQICLTAFNFILFGGNLIEVYYSNKFY